jgi:hypothetical protein
MTLRMSPKRCNARMHAYAAIMGVTFDVSPWRDDGQMRVAPLLAADLSWKYQCEQHGVHRWRVCRCGRVPSPTGPAPTRGTDMMRAGISGVRYSPVDNIVE